MRIILFLCLFLSSQVNAANPSVADSKLDTLSVVSWNVWFDDDSGKDRYPLIIEQLAQWQPTVILLQEVTPDFYSLLTSSRLLRQYHMEAASQSSYTNVILSRLPLQYARSLSLPSYYGRKALLADITWNGKDVTLVNVHLDSGLKDVEQRLKQIDTIERALYMKQLVVWGGDFNFGNGSKEANTMARSFVDVAESMGLKLQPTYDPNNNPLAKKTRFSKESARRLDRIYLNEVAETSRVHYEVLNPLHLETSLYLSDHSPIRLRLDAATGD